ncbi:hypothetical protein EIP91_011524 [Steccherinum ochraceum]|uniref:JmjC domain-containing protein n=1 Tax=Steccherinum ochraceum TaxID=92696 RepID=A0A4R0R253_9APHY|nr:hypothetical protein EIP91_011524 [Steccherinum ochraceum]
MGVIPRDNGPHDFTHWNGKPYKPEAETIEFQDGTICKAPYKVSPVDGKTNAIPHDTNHVKKLAKNAIPAWDRRKHAYKDRACKYYQVIEYDPGVTALQVARQIDVCLACGHFVHLMGFPSQYALQNFHWSKEGFEAHLAVLPAKRFQAQDAEKRTESIKTGNKDIYDRYNIEEFCNHVHNDASTVSCAIMDAPVLKASPPLFMQSIDHAHTAYVAGGDDKYRKSIPIDVKKSEGWTLYHTGGYHTYNHFDSNGYATYVTIVDGAKCWVFGRHPDLPKCKNKDDYHSASAKVGAGTVKFPEDLERFYVWAVPGDILIQPPGQFHEVYTPIPTVSTGGHFYSFDTMHLSETAMYFNHNRRGVDTNFNHPSTSLTACLMMNSIKDRGPREYSKKGLMGLCMVVTKSKHYFRHFYLDPDHALKKMMQTQRALKKGRPDPHAKPPAEATTTPNPSQQEPPVTEVVLNEVMIDRAQALENARTLIELLKFDFDFGLSLDNKQTSQYAFKDGLFTPGETVFLTEEILSKLNAYVPLLPGEEDAFSSDYTEPEDGLDDDDDDLADEEEEEEDGSEYEEPVAKSLKRKAAATSRSKKGKGVAVPVAKKRKSASTSKASASKAAGPSNAKKGKSVVTPNASASNTAGPSNAKKRKAEGRLEAVAPKQPRLKIVLPARKPSTENDDEKGPGGDDEESDLTEIE